MIFFTIVLAVCLQVYLTVKKLSPFLSLLIVSVVAGFMLGMSPSNLLHSIEKGVSSTLGGLALIICLGAILGRVLDMSGAAEQISTTFIKSFGEKHLQWAMMLTGFLIGIPLYYNAGFVILVPLVFTLVQKTKYSLLYIAIPMAAALSTTHCFLPPHPGPVVLVNAFHANTGTVLMYGLLIAIPAVVIAGPILGRSLKQVKGAGANSIFANARAPTELPGKFVSFAIALLPVFLISLSLFAGYVLDPASKLSAVFTFIGDTTIALFVSVLLAIYLLGIRQRSSMEQIKNWVAEAVAGIAMILLIITAGGVFKQVLTDSGTGAYIASFSSKWQMSPLLFAWVITALLRITLGSATVAGITAAGIVAPLITSSGVSPELLVLSVGAGSVFGSHINDPGFWMFKEFFNLSLKQTFFSWTVMETLISLIGLAGVLLLNMII
jgi:Gnt-I system high-affinity gluconate transporter